MAFALSVQMIDAIPLAFFASIAGMIIPISRFSLETHEGPYEKWPDRSRLSDAGVRTDQKLQGYTVIRQFSIGSHFLLILDFDCPFEEANVLYLLNHKYRVLSKARIPQFDGNLFPPSYLLEQSEIRGPFELALHYLDLPSRLIRIDLHARGFWPRYMTVEVLDS